MINSFHHEWPLWKITAVLHGICISVGILILSGCALGPRPPVADPGIPPGSTLSGHPPSDAVILLDGTDLSEWQTRDGNDPGWVVGDGYVQVEPGSGDIWSRRTFGDIQLHVEWATPEPPRGRGQGRGNSGVFLMGRYEVQVLDSWESRTYPTGQAAALYGQEPPLVNASRPPGEWQTFDIVFTRPRFAEDGRLESRGRITVFHNNILVLDNVEIRGPTHFFPKTYSYHPDRQPVRLQDHGSPVRFRTIWIRDLEN